MLRIVRRSLSPAHNGLCCSTELLAVWASRTTRGFAGHPVRESSDGTRPERQGAGEREGEGQEDARVDFGFRYVSEGEKDRLVRGVFSSVAQRYDVMNDLMSAGLHRIWKDYFVDQLRPFRGMKHLDVAGGTGDIAFRILGAAAALPATGEPTEVTVLDINEEMLAEGQRRAEGRVWPGCTLEWVHGNAEELPFPDGSFDAYTVAFGIRNVTRRDRALREAHRVLRPGGRFHCLELSHVSLPFLRELYDAYSFEVIPRVGQAVAGDGDSYRYLVESIRQFPAPEDFAQMIRAQGLRGVRWEALAGGVVAIHSGFKV